MINFENTGYTSGEYPLFLGEELGLQDEINITYPELKKIKDKQQSMFWLPEEFNFNQDRVDLQTSPDYERDIMILNLLSQWSLDSLAARSIIELFGPLVSNSELHSWFLVQSFFEDIHASTYSLIIRTAFDDPNQAIQRGMTNLHVFERTNVIGKVFSELKRLTGAHMKSPVELNDEVRKIILKGVFTLYALEQISFMSSFASSFALVETGKYQSIGKAVGSICNDEMVHAKGDKAVFTILLNEPEYYKVFTENINEFAGIFNSVVSQEHSWSNYIFADGRKTLGLNTELLVDYVNYMAAPCYHELSIEWPTEIFGGVNKTNPLSYMDKYIDRNMVQTAPQELELNNYRVGQFSDDSGDEIFDF